VTEEARGIVSSVWSVATVQSAGGQCRAPSEVSSYVCVVVPLLKFGREYQLYRHDLYEKIDEATDTPHPTMS
jgi:hypothetical protein